MSARTTEATGGAPPPVAPARRRNVAVDGLRGLCAVALLFTHVAMIQGLLGTKELGGVIAPSNPVGGFFAGGLQIFAGVFFVMTGLFVYRPFARAIITRTERPRNGTVVRRMLRLLPAYYVMYLVVLVALNLQQITGPWYVLRPLLLLHIYDWDGWMHGMEITWTVPDIAQFYLLLPLIAWASWRYASNGATERSRALRMMVPIPLMFAVGIAWLVYSQINELGTRALFWWPMGLLPEIGIGMFIAIMIELSKASPGDTPRLLTAAGRHPLRFLAVAAVCVVVNMARPGSEIGMDDIYTMSGLLIFYGLLAVLGLCLMLPVVAPGADRSRFIRVVFHNRVLVYLGTISYGIYLWHFPVMHFLLQQPQVYFGGEPLPIVTIRGTTGFWTLQLATFLGTVIIAALSYRFLEKPLTNWGERLLARRRAATPGPAATEDRTPVTVA